MFNNVTAMYMQFLNYWVWLVSNVLLGGWFICAYDINFELFTLLPSPPPPPHQPAQHFSPVAVPKSNLAAPICQVLLIYPSSISVWLAKKGEVEISRECFIQHCFNRRVYPYWWYNLVARIIYKLFF